MNTQKSVAVTFDENGVSQVFRCKTERAARAWASEVARRSTVSNVRVGGVSVVKQGA